MHDRNTGIHPLETGLDEATVARWKAGVQAERERDRPPAGFPALPPIPGGRYRDPAFFDLERQALWREGWIHEREGEPSGVSRLVNPAEPDNKAPVMIVSARLPLLGCRCWVIAAGLLPAC